VLFYEEGGPGSFSLPTLATFSIDGPALAATGVEPSPWLISAGVLSLLGVVLVAGSSARRKFATR
jgi:LPXTG-motif cell wall-anchored protein